MKSLLGYVILAAVTTTTNALSIAGSPPSLHQAPSNLISRDDTTAIGPLLDDLCSTYNLPGLSLSLTNSTTPANNATSYSAQSGLLSLSNTTLPVLPLSPWPLGSNTKSLTATLIALLIQDNLLSWNTTLGELFSSSSPNGSFQLPAPYSLHPSHANTTISQLASHRSGLTGTFGIDQPAIFATQLQELYDMSAATGRALAASTTLTLPVPQGGEPGRFTYANDNYILLGFVVDVVTNRTVEEVMRERVWEPLGMKSARWGSPLQEKEEEYNEDDRDVEANLASVPWPHLVNLTGDGTDIYAYKKDWSVRFRDLPPYENTAGVAWMDVEDYQRWLRAQVDEELWGGKLGLTRETVTEWLHAKVEGEVDPEKGEYDYTYGGWVWASDAEECGGDGVCLSHVGSNTMYVANAWVDTGKNLTVAAFTNAPLAGGGTKGTNVAIEMVLNGTIVF